VSHALLVGSWGPLAESPCRPPQEDKEDDPEQEELLAQYQAGDEQDMTKYETKEKDKDGCVTGVEVQVRT